MANVYDTIVIGGGAIGASCAWQIAKSHRSVLLLERGRLGGEASSAAAGMLGAQLEVSRSGPFFQLCLESRRLYPEFAEQLLVETGIDIQLVQNGILQVAADEETANRLRQRLAWQLEAGGSGEWWSAADVVKREPLVAPGVGAVFLPDDGNVNAALLARAVGEAARKHAEVREGAYVTAIKPEPAGVAVSTPEETFFAEQVVLAAGAWAHGFLSALGVSFPIHPVKGQLLAIRPRQATLTHTIHTESVYLVPKRDGTIVVGATEEHGAGFDREITARGLTKLLQGLAQAAPGLADAVFERAWTGLRPGSAQGKPLIGRLSELPQVIVAVGHFRNGVLLSPVTARIVRSILDEQPQPELWSAFAPDVVLRRSNLIQPEEASL
ncbi:glycine oxidase ThiO [Alicyclobacillus herbarius]|uniref:glycine oxidase ThiO n=1 Tax=Alicyclobacillus herbarius TaxID=122960 RepID=UPI00041AED81|nr:glycine oxidase ThiO [Alicyclobacillus herbarius]